MLRLRWIWFELAQVKVQRELWRQLKLQDPTQGRKFWTADIFHRSREVFYWISLLVRSLDKWFLKLCYCGFLLVIKYFRGTLENSQVFINCFNSPPQYRKLNFVNPVVFKAVYAVRRRTDLRASTRDLRYSSEKLCSHVVFCIKLCICFCISWEHCSSQIST